MKQSPPIRVEGGAMSEMAKGWELSPGWGDIGNVNCIKKTVTRNQRTQVSKYCFSHLWTVKAHTLIWAASTPTAMISQFLWLGSVQRFPCWGPIRPNSRLSWATDSSGSLCFLGWYYGALCSWGSGLPASSLAAHQGPMLRSHPRLPVRGSVLQSRATWVWSHRGNFWFCSEGVWIYIKYSRRRLCHRSPRRYLKQRLLSVNTPAVGNTMTSHGQDILRN